MKPLEDDERRLATVTARVIARAHEAGLPDAPDKLVAPRAIQLLARAHLELIDRVEQLHGTVGDLEKLAEIRRALQDQVQSIQDRVDEIARVAIEGALREVARQQGGIASEQIVEEAKSEGMLAAKPLIGAWVNTTPNARRRAFPQPADADKLHDIRVVPTLVEIAKLSGSDLLAIYCRVMRETEAVFAKYESYVVRVWDGMDGCWTNCTGEVDRDAALRYWAERTNGGTHHITYAEIDYYRIFPGGTRMTWNGSEGREMHR